MKEVQVNVPGHSYTIKLGSGVIKDLPAELKRLNPSSCLIVTNITVGSLYLKKVSELRSEERRVGKECSSRCSMYN